MEKVKELLQNSGQIDKVARIAFDQADKDKSGFVSKQELEPLAAQIASLTGIPAPTKIVVHQAMHFLDKDHDGQVSFDEFKVLVTEMLKLM